MDRTEKMQQWLAERDVVNLEMIVADMAGVARGKMQPTAQLSAKGMKLPIAIFAQSINNDYYMPKENVADRDMNLQPDVDTLRLVPWATEPTASVLMDCYDIDGQAVETSPRAVLKRVLKAYAERGWTPVVAPEVEFYLTQSAAALPGEEELSEGAIAVENDANLNDLSDPYGLQSLHDLGGFFEDLSAQCRTQDIHLGAASQELGPAQFEVNLEHGAPLKLADDVFHFKRTIKQVAAAHGKRATFLAKPLMDGAGSSMHIHQSLYDAENANVFSDSDGEASELFNFYLGGLQKYMRSILLLFAPYANSYRRFLNYYASPVNLEWGVDNRTAGLRVPRSDANARRVENRLAGSDVNPYLAIAGSLACGYLGMTEKVPARPAVTGSAQELPFALHRHLYEALDDLRESTALHEILGAEFVTQYCAVKELEYRDFQQHISDWERDNLMFSV